MGIIIEVGVNTGSDTVNLLERFPNSYYYGFEPTLELYSHLTQKFKSTPYYERMMFLPMAVSDRDGKATFNVAGQGDWGCSSLHEFNPDIHSIWANRSDFKFTHTEEIVTIRLDSFLDVYNKEDHDIEYIWIDAQGHDLIVLQSAGKSIKKIKAGRLEVAYTVELYKNTINNLENAKEYLDALGFKYKVTPDDVGKECNIDFWRE